MEDKTTSNDNDSAEILEKLESLEKREKNNWRTTLMVGVVLALIQGFAVWYNASKQEELKTEFAGKFATNTAIAEAIVERKKNFYSDAMILLQDIDDSFQEACYFNSFQQVEKKMPELLEKYRKLLARPAEELSSNSINGHELIKGLGKYSSYIAEKWGLILQKGKLNDEEKIKCYKESKILFNEAMQQLGKLLSI
jgi:hypothetical protein